MLLDYPLSSQRPDEELLVLQMAVTGAGFSLVSLIFRHLVLETI